jgi:hypothetical protein
VRRWHHADLGNVSCGRTVSAGGEPDHRCRLVAQAATASALPLRVITSPEQKPELGRLGRRRGPVFVKAAGTGGLQGAPRCRPSEPWLGQRPRACLSGKAAVSPAERRRLHSASWLQSCGSWLAVPRTLSSAHSRALVAGAEVLVPRAKQERRDSARGSPADGRASHKRTSALTSPSDTAAGSGEAALGELEGRPDLTARLDGHVARVIRTALAASGSTASNLVAATGDLTNAIVREAPAACWRWLRGGSGPRAIGRTASAAPHVPSRH